MTLDEYQADAMRTMARREPVAAELDRAIMGLGLTGESGEVAELLKKNLGHGHELNPDALTKELGDVLWYVSAIATQHGLSLGTIADQNIAKLRIRYPEGFSHAASRERT